MAQEAAFTKCRPHLRGMRFSSPLEEVGWAGLEPATNALKGRYT